MITTNAVSVKSVTYKNFLIISIVVNILFLSFMVVLVNRIRKDKVVEQSFRNEESVAWTEFKRQQNRFFDARYQLFKTMPVDADDVVLLGNSITEGWAVHEAFPGKAIKNYGMAGLRAADLPERLDMVRGGRKIFIDLGINDLKDNVPADIVVANLVKSITVLKSNHPRIRLYVESLLPTCGNYATLNGAIRVANVKIDSMCKKQAVTFVNTYPGFLKGEQMDSTLSYDGLHLNEDGYKVLTKELAGYIN